MTARSGPTRVRAKSSRSSQSACQARSTSWARHADLRSANRPTTWVATAAPSAEANARRTALTAPIGSSAVFWQAPTAAASSGPLSATSQVTSSAGVGIRAALSRWLSSVGRGCAIAGSGL